MISLAEASLPTGWSLCNLSEVAQITGGIQKQPKRRPTKNAYPFLRVANVGRGTIDLQDVHEIELFEGELDRFRLNGGDLLVVEGNGSADQIGRAAVWDGSISNAVHQNHLIRVRPTKVISAQYLGLLWNSPTISSQLKKVAQSTSGLYTLSTSKLARVRVPVPPRSEQDRIVETLEFYLSRLEVAERLIDRSAIRSRHLEKFISSITHIYEPPNGTPPSATLAPRGTDDRMLPKIPQDWTWRRLEEIANVVGGVTKDKKKQSDPALPEIPYLRVANVQRGWLDLSEITVIRVPEKKALQLALKDGDVLLNEGGDRDKLGRGWVWENQVPGAIHQNHVFRARIHGDILHPKLLSWYANSVASWFDANGKQSVNLASISLSKIKQLPVPIPPLEEQAAIVERIDGQLSMLDAAVNLSRQAKSKAKDLRQAILSRAFSGKLVPQDPTDEPVSALLDRIHADHRVEGGKSQAQRITRRRRKSAVVVDAPPPPFTTVALVPTNAVQQELSL